MLTLKTLFISIFFVYNFDLSAQVENKIIQGNEVPIENFPYVVSIRYNDNHVCGGAILDKRTIVTSAQCVFDIKIKSQLISIRAGSSKHANGKETKISGKPIQFPTYNREFHENDIAIIKLAESLVWDNTIKPISLIETDSLVSVPDGTVATFVGWGVSEENGTKISDSLLKSDATIISYIQCTMHYGINMIYPHMMLCAESTGREFCRGDLGAPLVVQGKLIGVASWIYECDKSTYPGVYTSVAKYRDWIQQNLEPRP